MTHPSVMSVIAARPAGEVRIRVLHLLVLTIIWMSVEATISLAAAWRAHSPALVALGGDSAIELLSAAAVFWRFHTGNVGAHKERLAARVAGSLLFALAAYVAVVSASALLGHRQANLHPVCGSLLLTA